MEPWKMCLHPWSLKNPHKNPWYIKKGLLFGTKSLKINGFDNIELDLVYSYVTVLNEHQDCISDHKDRSGYWKDSLGMQWDVRTIVI